MPSLTLIYIRLMAKLPLPASHAVGRFFGRIASWIPSRLRTVTDINLATCFSELDVAGRRRLRRLSLMHFGCVLTESPRIWLGNRETVLGMVVEVQGEELVRQAFAAGKGVMFCAPHLGCWEIIGNYLAITYPLTIMYRPQQGALDELSLKGREQLGAKLVPTDQGGVKALLAALRRGEAVGVLPDQDAKYGGLFVNFFGHPANTPALPAKLAAKTGAPVIFTYGERLPRGRGFRIHFALGSAAIANADSRVGTQALSDDLERCIRQLPAQYWWSYQRFRRRPAGVARVYPRKSSKRQPARR